MDPVLVSWVMWIAGRFDDRSFRGPLGEWTVEGILFENNSWRTDAQNRAVKREGCNAQALTIDASEQSLRKVFR